MTSIAMKRNAWPRRLGAVLAGLAARLAPDYPARHAWALAGVGVVFSIAGAVAMWEMGPPWYSLAAR